MQGEFVDVKHGSQSSPASCLVMGDLDARHLMMCLEFMKEFNVG